MKRLSTLVVALTMTPAVAAAQICLGNPSLANSNANLGVAASFGDGTTGVGASVGVGNDMAFVAPSVGYVSYNDADASSTVVGATAGFAVKAGQSSPVRLCPIVQLNYGFGPNEDTELGRLSTNQFGALGGLAVAGVARVSPGFAVIPNAFGGVLYQRLTAKLGGESESVSETGGAIGGGVSLLFNDLFAIVPTITVPLGFDSSDPVFSIGVTIGLGRR